MAQKLTSLAQKERGILFSAPMVLALLAGVKTQTRRVVKPQPPDCNSETQFVPGHRCPYGRPGERLWVKETWRAASSSGAFHLEYRADGSRRSCSTPPQAGLRCQPREGWRSSLFMPRWASRLTLDVLAVRMERLHSISEEDAAAEGDFRRGALPSGESHRDWYKQVWLSINGADSWERNPWVWVVHFRVLPPAANGVPSP